MSSNNYQYTWQELLWVALQGTLAPTFMAVWKSWPTFLKHPLGSWWNSSQLRAAWMLLLSRKMYGLAWTKHLTTNEVSLVGERTEKMHERRKRETIRDWANESEGRISQKKESNQKPTKRNKSGNLNLWVPPHLLLCYPNLSVQCHPSSQG